MNILDKIIANKREQIFRIKSIIPITELANSENYGRTGNSLKEALTKKGSSGIIAEFKRKSPSKGSIKANANVEQIIAGYANSGAAAVSILTDSDFFGGSKDDLILARKKHPELPILRKDFMIDTYQLHEAKSWGADAILLIAAVLSPEKIIEMGEKAHELGLEVLLEVHDFEELQNSPLEFVDLVGVNNRNLKNFSESNINASLGLYEHIPSDKVKISESCISEPERVVELKKLGYNGFLIGEPFMKAEDPSQTLANYVEAIKG
ncbi:indole-3-glycerol phosphate synthase TrpC [Marinilongibacter aquaticus]|uniref:indole-3-glycerol phosphate synthase TrpC n=1 Tax=Marinilongibacter aquaticus TaxID=2975157 RepID=UPI0021BD98E3|nr:indole-3-glycerol phosphate synthase TrpC [Marinilongibacter aquaticus]UBM60693.1 indole-3-glycerol phosphate synthase TrpC [Marinilongibacter aquaticus]